LETLWKIRQEADEKVTKLLKNIKEYNKRNNLNISLLENGRIGLDFAFNRQGQENRVNTFLVSLGIAIKNETKGTGS